MVLLEGNQKADKWAEKEKELEKEKNDINQTIMVSEGIQYPSDIELGELNGKIIQLRECKEWHDEQIEEHTQRCAKDMIQQNYIHYRDLKEAFEKKVKELRSRFKKRKVDCQDCGNPNCQNSNHTFTYMNYLTEKDVDEIFGDEK